MLPRLVPEISPLDAFCDVVVVVGVVGIGDSRSWMPSFLSTKKHQTPRNFDLGALSKSANSGK